MYQWTVDINYQTSRAQVEATLHPVWSECSHAFGSCQVLQSLYKLLRHLLVGSGTCARVVLEWLEWLLLRLLGFLSSQIVSSKFKHENWEE